MKLAGAEYSALIERLQRRAAEVRSRHATRLWEYRQRNLSKGVWFRLRRLLAESREVFIVPAEAAERLLTEGFVSDPVGDQLFPRKALIVVPAERAAQIADAKKVSVRLGAELLAARHVMLVLWE